MKCIFLYYKLWPLYLSAILLISCISLSKAANVDSLVRIATSGTKQQRLSAYKTLAVHYITHDFDKAITYGKEGIAVARSSGDSVVIGELLNIIGDAEYFRGNYDSASTRFFTALRIFEKKKAKKQKALVLNSIAKLYRKTRELDKADMYYDKAMLIFEELNDSAGMEMIWNESGVVYEYRGDYAEATRRYSKALQLAELTGNKVGVGYALNNISGSYLLQGRYEEAEATLLKAMRIRKGMNDSFALAINYSDLGAVYDTMMQYNRAAAYFDTSNTIAKALKYPQLLAHNYEMMSGIAKRQGNFEQAYDYFLRADAINDSLYKVERLGQVEELNTKYQTEKKEQQILLQQVAIGRRNLLIAGVSLLLVMGALLGYSYYHRYKLKQEKRLQEEIFHQQQLATQAVLEAEENERERIAQDLHDGVGQMMSAVKINLSTFHDRLEFHTPEDRVKYEGVIELVDESCKEVRTISHNMMPNALLKAGLATAVREFVTRIDESILEVNVYTEGLNERMHTDTETILYRVIQECVNNAIKHAAATRLDISIIKDADGISVSVEDNGRGFDTTKAGVFDGIGLKNIHTRIAYLKGQVDFDSKPGKGTVITIHIPYG